VSRRGPRFLASQPKGLTGIASKTALRVCEPKGIKVCDGRGGDPLSQIAGRIPRGRCPHRTRDRLRRHANSKRVRASSSRLEFDSDIAVANPEDTKREPPRQRLRFSRADRDTCRHAKMQRNTTDLLPGRNAPRAYASWAVWRCGPRLAYRRPPSRQNAAQAIVRRPVATAFQPPPHTRFGV